MSSTGASIQTILGREKATSDFVPYSVHVSEHNIKTSAGDIISIIKLEGAAHESADPEKIQAWHEALHGMLKNAVNPDVAIWRHTVRRSNNYYPAGEFDNGFARDLDDKYRAMFAKHKMMQNDLYLTFVIRGEPKPFRLFKKKGVSDQAEALKDIEHLSRRLDEIVEGALASLSIYQPTRLACYKENNLHFSQPMEFLAYLLSGTWAKMPVPRTKIANVLAKGRLSFGIEAGEMRGVASRKLFAMVTATDYPEFTETGDLTQLLTLPFELVITHSFAFIAKQTALSLVETQQSKLINTKDAASSQIEDLYDLKEDLTANRVGMGEHHFSILVTADDDKTLIERISIVAANLSEAGFGGVVREDLALEAAFFAQLPAVFDLRPRPAPITTRNFAGLIAMHNYPVGHASQNQWGPAVTVLKTTAGSPFYFNFHLPLGGRKIDLRETSGGEDRVAGHTLVVGPTGSGKTVDIAFLLAQAEKYKPTTFAFDKDNGLETYIRAQGGQYNIMKLGDHTGWNPMHLPPTPRNTDFLVKLVEYCCGVATLSDQQRTDIHEAVQGVLTLRFEDRQFVRLLEYLPNTESNGPYTRLQKWVGSGRNAWIFDNPTDNMSLAGTRHFGFDVTDFIENDELRSAIVMYIYHRMEDLIGTRRFIMVMDEFWKMLRDPFFAAKADDAVRTWRKRDAFGIFGTQGPREVLDSPIATSLLSGCVTQILKPAPSARWEDYGEEGLKLSDREFEIVKQVMPERNMRGFLFRQGNSSVVCELNLKNFRDELSILSSNSTTAEICRKAVARAGADPALWMPVFHQYRRGL